MGVIQMVFSMTGYGRGESKGEGIIVTVEIKAVNHRYLEIKTKMPKAFAFYEDKIVAKIKRDFFRGHFEVNVNIDYGTNQAKSVVVDEALAEDYFNKFKALSDKIGVAAPTLQEILAMPEVIKVEDSKLEEESVCLLIKMALYDAVKAMKIMRANEGMKLRTDFNFRDHELSEKVEKISKRFQVVSGELFAKTKKRISDILQDVAVDENRIYQEVAIMVDRMSIDEELVRLDSHLAQFNEILDESGAIGRKLDFLVQEINREINTIASKSNDLEINQIVIDAKSDIEKLREQIQNVE